MTALRNYLSSNVNLLMLVVWFGSMTLVYARMPYIASVFDIVLFPILIIAELSSRYKYGKLSWRVSIVDVSIIAYFLYVTISLLTNQHLPLEMNVYGMEFLLNIVTPVMIYWYVRLKPLTPKQITTWTYFYVFIVVMQTIIGYISLRHPTLLPEIYQPRPHLLYTRGFGTFASPEGYVLTLLFGMAFIFNRSIGAVSVREKWLLRSVLFVGFIGAIFSQNRAGWINVIILLVVICYLDRSLIKWVISLIIVSTLIVSILAPSFVAMTLERLQGWREIESRIIMIGAGVRLFAEKPILGWGYASYDLHDWKYMDAVGPLQPTRYELAQATSHNTYLTILSETGLVGFMLYYFPTLCWFVRTFRALRSKIHSTYDRHLLIMMWTIIIFVHMSGQFADMRFFSFVLGYWWLALAIIANTLTSPSPQVAVSRSKVT